MARIFLTIFLILCSGSIVTAEENYPQKAIGVVVGFAPGGTADTVQRIVNEAMQKQTKVPFVVINKPGMSGSTAVVHVSRANPDGYTLLGISVQFALWPAIAENAPYSINDVDPVAKLGSSPMTIVTHPDAPWNTVEEMIAYARKNPGKLKVGVTGYGSAANMIFTILKRKAGIEITFIPYVSETETLTSALGGHVDVAGIGLGTCSPHIQAQRLKALGCTGDRRNPLIPQVPSFSELGYSDASISTYFGVLAPLKVPRDRIYKLSKYYSQAMKDGDVISKLEKLGFVPDYLPPEEFRKFLTTSYENFRKVAAEEGMKIK